MRGDFFRAGNFFVLTTPSHVKYGPAEISTERGKLTQENVGHIITKCMICARANGGGHYRRPLNERIIHCTSSIAFHLPIRFSGELQLIGTAQNCVLLDQSAKNPFEIRYQFAQSKIITESHENSTKPTKYNPKPPLDPDATHEIPY